MNKILIILIVLTSIVACNKDVENNIIVNKTTVENPYSWVGEKHNEILTLLEKNSKNQNFEMQYKTISNYFDLKSNGDSMVFSEQEFLSLLEMLNNNNFNSNIITDSLYQKNFINIKQKLYLDSLTQIIKTYGSDVAFESKITSIEQDVIEDNELLENQKEIILVFSAVAKKSKEYWYSGKKSSQNIFITILADAVGGAVGNAFGGPIGGVALGAAASYSAAHSF